MDLDRFRISVMKDGVVYKTIKSKFDKSQIFTAPLANTTYWKASYDVNRLIHIIERLNAVPTVLIESLDDKGDVIESATYEHRQLFYNAVRKVTDGLKRYNDRKVPVRIVNNFTHGKNKKPAAPVVEKIDIKKTSRKALVDMAKALGVTGYSDANMQKIADMIYAKQSAAIAV